MVATVRSLLVTVLVAGSFPDTARGEPAPGPEIPPAAREALQGRLSVPGARLVVRGWQPAGRPCPAVRAEVGKAVTGSGRYAVKLSGPRCSSWGWATIDVLGRAYVTTRPVAEGERLDAAVSEIEKEIRPGRQPVSTIRGARAGRALAQGQVIEAAHLDSAGPKPGESIEVIVRSGSLRIVQTGRIVGCGRNRACALMPSGKHVEGQLVEGRLLVEAP